MAKNKQLYMDIGQGLSIMIGLPTLSSWDTAGRPTKPKIGTFGFNYQTNNLEYWNGRYWLGTTMNTA